MVFLISNKACDLWEIGIMLIVAAVVIYASNIYLHPYLKPDNILEPAGMRIRVRADDLFYGSFFKCIGYFASMGAVFLICSIGDVFICLKRKILFTLFLILSLIILNSTGQRLFITNVLIATSAILFLCKPKNKKFILYLNIILLLIIFSIIIVGLIQENEVIDQVFNKNATLAGRLNRSMWYDSIQFIQKKPLFGYGLGGYAECAGKGVKNYPHNLLLELLVETGILGTIIILIPVIYLFFIPKIKRLSTLRTARGQIIFPFLLTLFSYAMISTDLSNSALFAVAAVFWAYCSRG